MTATDINHLTTALRAAAEAFLDALDTNNAPSQPSKPPTTSGPLTYDPLTDPPPLPYDPVGAGDEKKMTSLAYLGAIARINADKHRGARADEVAKYARIAGYPDGRAVSGWNTRGTSERVIDNIDGERFLNMNGHAYVQELADDLGIELVGAMTPLSPTTDNQGDAR